MTDDPTPPLNREQRRRQKFRRPPSARQDNLHTERENSTGFLTAPVAAGADGAATGEDAAAAGEEAAAAGEEAAAAGEDAPAAADVSADVTPPDGGSTAEAAAARDDAADPEVQPGG